MNNRLTLLGVSVLAPFAGFGATFVALQAISINYIALSCILILISLLVGMLVYALVYYLYQDQPDFGKVEKFLHTGMILNIMSLVLPYLFYIIFSINILAIGWCVSVVLYIILICLLKNK